MIERAPHLKNLAWALFLASICAQFDRTRDLVLEPDRLPGRPRGERYDPNNPRVARTLREIEDERTSQLIFWIGLIPPFGFGGGMISLAEARRLGIKT